MDYKFQITVGKPVWGVEKSIRRSLLSVLEQDFEDMEILVIDDCGTDKSIDIATDLANTHPKGNKANAHKFLFFQCDGVFIPANNSVLYP